jgi:hypothetical protein
MVDPLHEPSDKGDRAGRSRLHWRSRWMRPRSGMQAPRFQAQSPASPLLADPPCGGPRPARRGATARNAPSHAGCGEMARGRRSRFHPRSGWMRPGSGRQRADNRGPTRAYAVTSPEGPLFRAPARRSLCRAPRPRSGAPEGGAGLPPQAGCDPGGDAATAFAGTPASRYAVASPEGPLLHASRSRYDLRRASRDHPATRLTKDLFRDGMDASRPSGL